MLFSVFHIAPHSLRALDVDYIVDLARLVPVVSLPFWCHSLPLDFLQLLSLVHFFYHHNVVRTVSIWWTLCPALEWEITICDNVHGPVCAFGRASFVFVGFWPYIQIMSGLDGKFKMRLKGVLHRCPPWQRQQQHDSGGPQGVQEPVSVILLGRYAAMQMGHLVPENKCQHGFVTYQVFIVANDF